MPKNKGKGKANAQDSKAEAVRDGVNERQSTRDGGQGTGERGQGALEGTGQGQISPRKQPLSDDGPAVGQEATTVESDETHADARVVAANAEEQRREQAKEYHELLTEKEEEIDALKKEVANREKRSEEHAKNTKSLQDEHSDLQKHCDDVESKLEKETKLHDALKKAAGSDAQGLEFSQQDVNTWRKKAKDALREKEQLEEELLDERATKVELYKQLDDADMRINEYEQALQSNEDAKTHLEEINRLTEDLLENRPGENLGPEAFTEYLKDQLSSRQAKNLKRDVSRSSMGSIYKDEKQSSGRSRKSRMSVGDELANHESDYESGHDSGVENEDAEDTVTNLGNEKGDVAKKPAGEEGIPESRRLKDHDQGNDQKQINEQERINYEALLNKLRDKIESQRKEIEGYDEEMERLEKELAALRRRKEATTTTTSPQSPRTRIVEKYITGGLPWFDKLFLLLVSLVVAQLAYRHWKVSEEANLWFSANDVDRHVRVRNTVRQSEAYYGIDPFGGSRW